MNNEDKMNNEFVPADEAIIKCEDLFRNILKTAMDGFWIADKQGRPLEVNEAYCRL
jgi:PAS domain-containing protein